MGSKWAYVVVSDLHVRADTLDRALIVLERAGDVAVEKKAPIVITGDFWDLRGTIAVRVVHAIMEALDKLRERGVRLVFVPGNHDQVTFDGSVHGLRVFGAYDNVEIATDPIVDMDRLVVFLPWREDPGEQASLFSALEGHKWTIFGHAEVQGARTNTQHTAPGRVTVEEIERVARACYLGHYHDRQQLGKCTWYIGSPFEMNMGERNKPHGIALVTSSKIEPTFIDWDDFPQHRRFELKPTERKMIDVDGRSDVVRRQDIVEVLWPVGTDESLVKTALAAVPAADVRPVPMPRERDESEAPKFALSLDQALEAYVAQEMPEALAYEESAQFAQELLELGRALLAEVPQTGLLAPLGEHVSFVNVSTQDFCALRGRLNLELENQGLLIILGPMGIGKTALLDAITWALFGQTTPRKPAGTSASLTGDDVIHDHANECSVELWLDVTIAGEKRRVIIERSKARGKGSKVTITGLPELDGVRDQQERIDRIIGLDYPLWRAAVSLGQGAVGNFLTGADKSRKGLLAGAYGLDAVGDALKRAKVRSGPNAQRLDTARLELAKNEGVLAELGVSDFARESQQWEQHRAVDLERLRAEDAQLDAVIANCNEHLAGEQQWLGLKASHEQSIQKWQEQLTTHPTEQRMAQLQRDLGAFQAERASLEQQLEQHRRTYQQTMAAKQAGPVPCPTCNRPLPAPDVEAHLAQLESNIAQGQSSLSTMLTRVSNVAQEIDAINNSRDSLHSGVRGQIAESQKALAQIGEALNRFAQIRANKANAETRKQQIVVELAWLSEKINPFSARQAEMQARIDQLKATVAEQQAVVAKLLHERGKLDFWERGFSPKGLPVLILRTALYELEVAANKYFSALTEGKLYMHVEMAGEDIEVSFKEFDPATQELRERRYEQLSGGERRCAELALSPFGMRELMRARLGTRLGLIMLDELTTHLGVRQKGIVCEMLRALGVETVLVVEHDVTVQAEFDNVRELQATANGLWLSRR